MKLYHGTSESSLKRILREGLLPRSMSNVPSNWEHTVDASPDRVYLSLGYAPYFAMSACEEGERWAILEIDKDRMVNDAFSNMSAEDSLSGKGFDYFYPDEDYVENVLRSVETSAGLKKHNAWLAEEMDTRGFPWSAEVMERTGWIRDNIDLFKFMAEGSLEHLGNVSYSRHIPLKCITRAVLYDPRSNPTMTIAAMDPTITTMNWRICSQKYTELTRWFLGYEDVKGETIRGYNGAGEDDNEKKLNGLKTFLGELEGLDESRMDTVPDISLDYKGDLRGVDVGEEFRDKTPREVIETVKGQIDFYQRYVDSTEQFNNEVLPNRSGIELIEVAQFGLGGTAKTIKREEFYERCLDKIVGKSNPVTGIRSGNSWVQQHEHWDAMTARYGADYVGKEMEKSVRKTLDNAYKTEEF